MFYQEGKGKFDFKPSAGGTSKWLIDWTEREPRPAPTRSFRVVSSFGLQPCARGRGRRSCISLAFANVGYETV